MPNPDAEAKKELGNKAFAKNKYDDAIRHYTAAIAVDASNCVYFSNRSACHGGKSDWKSAASDAKECIRVNPSFVKGYYRLATAQCEQGEYEAALATIKQGLAIDNDNPQLQKQMRQVKARRSTARRAERGGGAASPAAGAGGMGGMPGGMGVPGGLDPSVSKEVMDLQQQLMTATREHRVVQAGIQRAHSGRRQAELTKSELGGISDDGCRMYRAVGKMFMLSTRKEVDEWLAEGAEREGKEERELTAKAEYLERRMGGMRQNIRELTGSSE